MLALFFFAAINNYSKNLKKCMNEPFKIIYNMHFQNHFMLTSNKLHLIFCYTMQM